MCYYPLATGQAWVGLFVKSSTFKNIWYVQIMTCLFLGIQTVVKVLSIGIQLRYLRAYLSVSLLFPYGVHEKMSSTERHEQRFQYGLDRQLDSAMSTQPTDFSILVPNCQYIIQLIDVVRDLGDDFDYRLTMNSNVSWVARIRFCHLRRL